MQISIKPLTPDLKDDYLCFFDNLTFEENPDWAACYCFSFHFTGTNEQWTRENNRNSIIKYISEKKLKGYLIYDSKIPVGWCNVNERKNYESLSKYYELPNNNRNKICSIVCFTIHPDYRRKGIARQVLETINNDYSKTAFDFLEAYPAKGNLSSEQHYRGPLEMYLKLGFAITKEHETYYVVRKQLK